MDNSGDNRIVPQADIDAVEKARCAMYSVLEHRIAPKDLMILTAEMGDALWRLTHTRYDKIKIKEG